MPKHKSEDYKKSAVEYYLVTDKTQEAVCRIFKCSVRSLLRWAEKYKRHGKIKRQNRKPIAYKVKKEHVKFILRQIKKNKTITTNDLLLKLKEKFPNLKLSRYHLARVIRDNNITLKQRRWRHEPVSRFGKPIDIKAQIKAFYKTVNKFKLKNIICIDETSLNTFLTRNFCYNELGKRCIVKTSSQEVFKKYTGIFAINSQGCIGWKLYQKGGIDSTRLVAFINEYITNKFKNKLIILDNASSHRNAKTKATILKNNNLLYSVPYQHYTNSIETFFSILKSKLKKEEITNFADIKKKIKKVLKKIKKETYKNIFIGSYKRNKGYKRRKSRKRPLKNYK